MLFSSLHKANVFPAYMSKYHLSARCPWKQGKCFMNWSLGYRWLWAAVWMLEREPASSGRVARLLKAEPSFIPAPTSLLKTNKQTRLDSHSHFQECRRSLIRFLFPLYCFFALIEDYHINTLLCSMSLGSWIYGTEHSRNNLNTSTYWAHHNGNVTVLLRQGWSS